MCTQVAIKLALDLICVRCGQCVVSVCLRILKKVKVTYVYVKWVLRAHLAVRKSYIK